MHSTVLHCIAQSVFCSFCACACCIFFYLFCAVKKNAKTRTQNTTAKHTAKHRKTPQNTVFEKFTILLRDPLRVRVRGIQYTNLLKLEHKLIIKFGIRIREYS